MPVEIKFKVGIGCTNNKIDVGNIQDALGRIKPADGGAVPPLVIDGLCGKKTIDAIQKFQLKHFGWSGADGKIFPDGQTLKKINEILKDPVVTAPTGVPRHNSRRREKPSSAWSRCWRARMLSRSLSGLKPG